MWIRRVRISHATGKSSFVIFKSGRRRTAVPASFYFLINCNYSFLFLFHFSSVGCRLDLYYARTNNNNNTSKHGYGYVFRRGHSQPIRTRTLVVPASVAVESREQDEKTRRANQAGHLVSLRRRTGRAYINIIIIFAYRVSRAPPPRQ